MALTGIADVILIYFVAKRLLGSTRFAAIASAGLALTPAHLIFSRQALDYMLPLPFVLGWLLCLLIVLERPSVKAALLAGFPPDNVRVVCEFMGGGFGSKNGPDAHTFIAAELARMTGRPVKCMLTRREENLDAGNRNATIQRLRAGARSDGTLTALDGEFVNSNGFGGWLASTGGPMRMLYGCENPRRTVLAGMAGATHFSLASSAP